MNSISSESTMNTSLIYKGTRKGTMVIKSLTITQEAYNALKQLKVGQESFSQIILRVSKEKKGNNLGRFFGVLKGKEGEEFEKRIKEGRKEFEKEQKEREKRLWGNR